MHFSFLDLNIILISRDEDGVKNRKTRLEAKSGELYQNRLIQNFEMVYGPTPKWARLDKKTKVKRFLILKLRVGELKPFFKNLIGSC